MFTQNSNMQAALCFDKAPTPLHDHSLSTEDLCMYLNLSDSLQELCTHNPDKFKTFGNCRGLFFQNTIIPVPFKCFTKIFTLIAIYSLDPFIQHSWVRFCILHKHKKKFKCSFSHKTELQQKRHKYAKYTNE